MRSMKTKSNNYLILLIAIISICSFANASVLFGPSIDKEKITKNEVALLSITIYNDSEFEIKDFLRLQSSDNISFVGEDEQIILTEFGPIKPYEKEIVKIMIKANNTSQKEGTVYGYYGINPDGEASYAFVGRIKIENTPVFVESKTKLQNTSTGDMIVTEYKLVNATKEALQNVAFEVKAPNGFEIKTAPMLYETVEANETITGTFEIQPPIETLGTQKIVLNYGYFDVNGPHFFEEDFDIDFGRMDSRLLLGVVGIIVLAVAIFLYMGSRKPSQNEIKGTADKGQT